MIQIQDVLNLLLNGYSDGRYLNGHPEICRWLDENPEPHSYVVEQLPDELGVIGLHNVRIWSSVDARDESIRRRATIANERPSEPRVSVVRSTMMTEHPLLIELYQAVDRKDLPCIVMLKQQCRNAGIKFDKNKTDLKRIGGLPNI